MHGCVRGLGVKFPFTYSAPACRQLPCTHILGRLNCVLSYRENHLSDPNEGHLEPASTIDIKTRSYGIAAFIGDSLGVPWSLCALVASKDVRHQGTKTPSFTKP